MKNVIYVIMLCVSTCAMVGCRSSIDTIDRYRYDSLAQIVTSIQKEHYESMQEKQVIIDSLRMAKLPVERSISKMPSAQRSSLETSLARSEAWVDTAGILNHSIENKDSAKLPIRKEVNSTQSKSESFSNKETSTDSSVSKIHSSLKKEFIKDKRFMIDFFYYSGVLGWLLVIGYVLYLLLFTRIKPFNRLFKLIKNLIK